MNRRMIEGEGFVWEGTKMVLTKNFLLERGYCCNSLCKNCPYKEECSDNEENKPNE